MQYFRCEISFAFTIHTFKFKRRLIFLSFMQRCRCPCFIVINSIDIHVNIGSECCLETHGTTIWTLHQPTNQFHGTAVDSQKLMGFPAVRAIPGNDQKDHIPDPNWSFKCLQPDPRTPPLHPQHPQANNPSVWSASQGAP